ncbi:FtsX-like permease family protein [Streptomyces sp. HPF1205]|uniref:FtsX-like permease family protein n=1 Tax=Streptomyces sp. HPF1205 TaxID=2873262 RepID=UPI001CECD604|nr:ABC transporter permease [Streptomyces sp. HPF1205]
MGRTAPGWVRVRLRAAPGSALATFALVMVTAFLAAALPRAVDRYEDRALRHAVAQASPRARAVSVTDLYRTGEDPGILPDLGPASVDRAERAFLGLASPPLRLLPGGAVYGVRTGADSAVPDPELPRTSTHPPTADLVAQAGLASQVRVVAGRLPRGASHDPDGAGGSGGSAGSSESGGSGGSGGSGASGGSGGSAGDEPATTLEAAVTERTAKVLRLSVGRTVHLAGRSVTPLTVRISGIVAPRDPSSAYWHEDSDLLAPVLSAPPTPPGEEPKTYWHFTMLLDRPDAVSIPLLGVGATMYWHHPVDASRLAAHDVSGIRKELASFDSGPRAVRLQRLVDPGLQVGSGFDDLLDTFAKDRSAASPLVLIAAVGVGTAALAVLLMAGGLAAERRRAEIALLRSRGGSLPGIVARLAGETCAAAVPGAAAGTALALALLPTQRARLSVLLGLGVLVAGAAALPLRAAWAVRRVRPAARDDVVAVRPSRRRLVLELTVTALVAGAVVALRQRGTASGPDGSDPFLAAAPALLAVAAALVLLRVYPLPLRLLSRPASRLTGAVAHLGLARAGRSPAAGQLPLLALLVSLTVASFGGSVLAGVDHGRDRAATATVGADARVDARFMLDPHLPDQVRRSPGVGLTVSARVEDYSPSPALPTPYSVVIVDPASYGELTRAIGLPAFPASVFASYHGHGPLPAVVSPKVAAAIGRAPTRITTGVGETDVRAAAVLRTTPAAPADQFVILSAAQLDARHPDMAPYVQYSGPTTILAMNAPGRHIDGPALHRLAKESTTYVRALLRSEQRAALADTPLQRGAREVYLAAIAAGAAYSALALLLSLLQAAPARAALLARLRTMGMTRRQARRLVLLEMLPQTLLAALGGVLVGLAAIPLLRPGVDLRALAFGPGSGSPDVPPVDFGIGLGLRADPWSLALPSVGLVLLACLVLPVQVWWSGRRRESTELRAGDRT